MIYLAADHGGFSLKEEIKAAFDGVGLAYEDLGAFDLVPDDDYPDYAIPAAKKVSESPKENKAILFCRSGTGEVIVANKFRGVRATLSWSTEHAKLSREKNDCNVLAIPADFIDINTAKEIIGAWLNTDFSKDERHIRRLKKIAEIDK
ncbi:hypothetical protein A2886_00525 [candidate division WWE3 bacterium RIFCSPHIGHO2_01_FULL_42_13]|uniref:Ribose-5-phosphate isomerase n=1 Tax=candidate division WWE3 bacterium RIFCSPHIGHO2_01_FULL_42_13 TaxID=1802617 RepID=A0A1F4UU89_UNCKA|nr:MAG: hypothetical protein A2886_00525 [candidate division WWE3 bacterium RIFCSPHIGHO2_01_FULL_42_13]